MYTDRKQNSNEPGLEDIIKVIVLELLLVELGLIVPLLDPWMRQMCLQRVLKKAKQDSGWLLM